MATTITALPQELVDQIIDDVGAEDKRAVANCALTCPSWTPRSSKHLLNTVSLYTHHLREFLSQAAASRRLAAHVTELSIAQPLQGEESFDLTPYLHDILRTLPNLRAFALFGERITIRAGLAPAPARKSLTHLRIARSHVEALPELLQLFSHIGALHLDQVYIKAPRTAPAPTGHLHVGTLHFDGTTGMLDVLRPSLDGSSLKSLRLKCDGYFRIDTAPVNAFLRSVGRNLSHFRLDLPLDGWVIAGPGTFHSVSTPPDAYSDDGKHRTQRSVGPGASPPPPERRDRLTPPRHSSSWHGGVEEPLAEHAVRACVHPTMRPARPAVRQPPPRTTCDPRGSRLFADAERTRGVRSSQVHRDHAADGARGTRCPVRC